MGDRLSAPKSGPPPAAKYSASAFREIPILDWTLVDSDPASFLAQLQYATTDVGFFLLSNVPGFDAAFQGQVVGEAHGFFDQPDDFKLQTDIRKSPYLRGSSRQDRVKDLRWAASAAGQPNSVAILTAWD
jgi:hypothetical protein